VPLLVVIQAIVPFYLLMLFSVSRVVSVVIMEPVAAEVRVKPVQTALLIMEVKVEMVHRAI
jgi:hypothetical protein